MACPTPFKRVAKIINDEDTSQFFDGQTHFHLQQMKAYISPPSQSIPPEEDNPEFRAAKHRHRDFFHRITLETKDVLRYVSPSDGKPKRMLVQATESAKSTIPGDWRRCDIGGNAPLFPSLATWVIGSKAGRSDELERQAAPQRSPRGWAVLALRVLVASPAFGLLLLVSFNQGEVVHYYKPFPSRTWEYPKHARNRMDAHPIQSLAAQDERGITFDIVGEQQRLLTPRKLMVYDDEVEVKGWCELPGDHQPYIFISYAAKHYGVDQNTRSHPELEGIAASLAAKHGVKAYWLDFRCREKKQPELTDDVHRLCDVIRGARRVCVVLPDFRRSTFQAWGSRLWTLPEALLSQSRRLTFYCPSAEAQDLLKTDLPGLAWTIDAEACRLLAEHFVGTLTLSRLELISVSLRALGARYWTRFQDGDLAYALMSLLRVRPRMDPTDSEYQALARLSLANDSDRIVERMVCMLPPSISPSHGWFGFDDVLGAKLWDIEPLCQVAGVCHDGSLILDGCRGISIRWKDIPEIAYQRKDSWTRLLAKNIVRSSIIWILVGAILIARTPFAGAAFLIIGFVLLFSAPWTARTIYGGKLWGQSPWFIGFEGMLPVEKIEELTFGNYIGRLRMAPSSSNFCEKSRHERLGLNPAAERLRENLLPAGHRLFTLIDTGTMTVSIYSALKPPSVALMCGREGGMLRVLLCSYERSTNMLHKQTVLRMETPIYEQARPVGWLKLG